MYQNNITDKEISIGNGMLKGKKGLIMGVANDRSLAWNIAQICHREGANIMISYQDDVFLKKVEPLASILNCEIIKCNVTNNESLTETFNQIEQKWENIDFIVHAIAFSDKNELRGRYVDTSLDNFLNTMHVSCYSFTAVAQKASKIMTNGGSILTLTYYGSSKVIPNYNVMGVAKSALECSVRYIANDLGDQNITVNAVSPGPVRTLASAGIGDFTKILDYTAKVSPMKRNIDAKDVGELSTFLLSDRAKNITGQIIYVDSGMSIMGI
ncbi:enoyl-ACP reductase FabI [Lyticum sinuosum]|uniref:Enoyl-[acyl-carrier-protein] reductase [NADH] n=1 Tax=Lyticum sinuosum TaxID=1332059 RepID=A0AAE5AGY6_9RICK|nr:enoyl-ACP reductase [Lyticum sinuosum]MDZ5761357.1 Enoyl-[acyl-carrier-protein] reductase FabI [Lyticum sinuosum]